MTHIAARADRVRVLAGEKLSLIGYGTLIGEPPERIDRSKQVPRILLDSCECIHAQQFTWFRDYQAPAMPSFDYCQGKPPRLFTPAYGITLGYTGKFATRLPVKVLAFEKRDFDHRPVIAARVQIESFEYFLLADEMTFPMFGE